MARDYSKTVMYKLVCKDTNVSEIYVGHTTNVENYSCNDLKEATKREGYWIKELKSNLNSNIAGRTIKEWYEDNKEKCKEWYQEYKIKNKEIIKERRKDHYNDNKEKILEKNKKYHDNNKDKIKEQKNEKVTCECGCETSKNHLSRHMKTPKHFTFLQSIQSPSF